MKTALITGGSRGIGRGIADYFADRGYRVAITSRGEADERARSRFLCIRADNAVPEDRERAVREALGAFGGIDALINNAGIAPKARADILESSEASFRELMEANLIGPYFLTQLVAREMVRAGRGTIVNVSSISAYAASVERGEYCVSKAGISMMTKLYAARLAEYGIAVYELRPGIIRTDMTKGVQEKYDRLIEGGLTPIRRWGTPEDVAKAAFMLCEGSLPFSTGEAINVDGGFHLRRL